MTRSRRRRLLVEGIDDVHSILHLMIGRGLDWDTDPRMPRVHKAGSIDELLDVIPDHLDGTYDRLGIVADADQLPGNQWTRIRDRAARADVQLPAQLDAEGLVLDVSVNAHTMRLGIWLMPDNASPGALEDFLAGLVPPSANALLDFARSCTQAAIDDHNAPVSDVHVSKANIHAFLAWQAEPGRPFGIALQANALDAHAPAAEPFVDWFTRLFLTDDSP